MKFTQIYKKNSREIGKNREAILATLKECREKDILKDYIEKHESEVIGIMMALYDKDSYMKLFEKRKEKEGEARLAKLIAKLISLGRNNEIERVASDELYRERLYTELDIGLTEA